MNSQRSFLSTRSSGACAYPRHGGVFDELIIISKTAKPACSEGFEKRHRKFTLGNIINSPCPVVLEKLSEAKKLGVPTLRRDF
ncbi:hypothetical protein A2833_00250 [Candidatus Azambacteria bacterium RIFCSPHIGHO2_01_FULL_44_55]|uniref:Uncharacterized protein n=1 Tax=Candidatus Azambacteria bacterium RIFCSPLOWO2_02_FULL_44_14 TaxID=1797306 RepID=A0A1F5CBE3_9BACT|nr:MAG: hypothetical protein A3C78_02050 [Candidatus Azambacteria bacterium RIFCSPHIGHO2_02_FULL_45_18]OGD40212.1 MAG: hypothetical protein A3I30_03020 [Candidatus Azambacteria bacterium RIFCSPLOWO2_02_FULL_44_14]OGD41605.1 MAG: hypothetical protein A2833_00250 [Candidatus Azambacteria bacterium RIFCSPHIGHO2_01_FULL_44_55]OGD51190.1 MAG: hypothetical protein A2608_01785 [Candidatus Azambacteria bacterium RIFOXYD1_FULL_44_10]